jgi:hypothetical protein
MRRKTEQGPMLLGVDLQDAKEEVFVRMVTDGISMGVAFVRAGFKSKHRNAASNLWQLSRIQERAAAILEARRTTGVVTLPQVTSMLQRVFSSAYHNEEYNAAHNSALSLARLYGHINDRQTLEVIRRPSRDPDAPSEQDLSSWVESLPVINAPGFSHSVITEQSSNPPPHSVPASLLATPADNPTEPRDNPTEPRDIDAPIDWSASHVLPSSGASRDISNDINDLPTNSRSFALNKTDQIVSDTIGLDDGVPGRPENGAPARPVTGTPNSGAYSGVLEKAGAHSDVLSPIQRSDVSERIQRSAIPPLKKKKVPRKKKQVPVKKRGKKIPSAKDLFG